MCIYPVQHVFPGQGLNLEHLVERGQLHGSHLVYMVPVGEMVDVLGLTTRQNNFLAVGGGPKKIFSFFLSQHA